MMNSVNDMNLDNVYMKMNLKGETEFTISDKVETTI